MIYIILISLYFPLTSLLANGISDYFPLKVGNSWTYTWYDAFNDPQRMKITIDQDTLINSKQYFHCSFPTIWEYSSWVRLDSVSGKLYALKNNGCQQNETLLDSLYAKKNDRTYLCGFDYRICKDTGNVGLFGHNFSTKEFGPTIVLTASTRKFAKGIGIYYMEKGDPFPAFYLLNGCVINGIVYGDTTLTSVHSIGSTIPEKFSLSQNYPNPFNPSTVISYELKVTGHVKLVVYDVLGNEIATLVNETIPAGSYNYKFSTVNYQLSSGIYFYRLSATSGAGDFSETKRMILLK